METETNSQIPFLDLNIKKTNNGLSTSIYRKPTFSGLGISFFSYCSFRFKVNSIRILLHRAYTLSSSYLDFHNDIIFLKDFFYNNGFTTDLFEKTLNKFLQSKYCPKQPIITVPKEVIYLRIPFLGDASKKVERCLCEKTYKFLS